MMKEIAVILAVLSLLSCSNNDDKKTLIGVWEQVVNQEEPEVEILGEAVIDPSTGIIEETTLGELDETLSADDPIIEGKHWVITNDSIGMFLHGLGIYQKYELVNNRIILTGDMGGFFTYKIIDSTNIELIGNERMILKKVDLDPSVFIRIK